MADTASYFGLIERLAAAARAETLPRWRTDIPADNKDREGSWDPVTEADRQAEAVMRKLIEGEQPDHGIDGEEYPPRPSQGPYGWSLDPVDGTRAFVCGLPTWTTLIALLEQGRPVLGVIDTPALDELYIGTENGSELVERGRRTSLRTSACAALADARVSTTDPFLFHEAGLGAFDVVRAKARTARYGFDAYAYARLAAGSIDLVIETGLKTYDYNALIPVVLGAGGTFGDWLGGEDYREGKVIAAASRELYDAAVEIMRGA